MHIHRLILLCLLCSPCLAADELEEDHLLSMEFETPHTKWAKPYARGKMRVLFFCNGRGTVPREIVELKQRFDFDAEAVYWARIVDTSKSQWHGGELGVARMLRLLERPFDCYVFIGIPLTQLSAEAQYKVLKPVTDGAGLVLVGTDDRRVLKERQRLTAPPPFIARSRPRGAYELKKGREVSMPGLPDIPYRLGWDTDYEYWAERLGRAIVWAAGREAKVRITRLDVPGDAIPWADATGHSTERTTSWHSSERVESRKTLPWSCHRHGTCTTCDTERPEQPPRASQRASIPTDRPSWCWPPPSLSRRWPPLSRETWLAARRPT